MSKQKTPYNARTGHKDLCRDTIGAEGSDITSAFFNGQITQRQYKRAMKKLYNKGVKIP